MDPKSIVRFGEEERWRLGRERKPKTGCSIVALRWEDSSWYLEPILFYGQSQQIISGIHHRGAGEGNAEGSFEKSGVQLSTVLFAKAGSG